MNWVNHPTMGGVDEINSGKNYIATCLHQPLYAGQPYIFNFYFGFGKLNNLICGEPLPQNSISPYGIAIYGRVDCLDYPMDNSSDTTGCLTHFSGWIMLGRVLLSGQNQWVPGVIEFTPPVNIYSIAVGADCSNNYNKTQDNELDYYMDKFVLAPKADFAFKTITAISGNACIGHYILQAPAKAKAYQWYKDGVLIPGATAQTFAVPDNAPGNYVANLSLPYNNCLNTLPYTVAFSDINKFSLGNDTTLCAPAEISLNASWPGVEKYLWQDGSMNEQLQVNKSGLYWVQVTEGNGCSKKDSINVTIKGCDSCQLFVPTAFTPNNDGLNDVFKAIPDCPNIRLNNFSMLIYNRWGEAVFKSNDINKGWNGISKNGYIDPGTYIYLINYSFKQNQATQAKGTVTLIK